MKYRALGRTGWKVSEISFGAWAIGGFWGHVSDEDAMKTLHKAIDSGVNFIDTANDTYLLSMPAPASARSPINGNQPPPQNPVFLIAGP